MGRTSNIVRLPQRAGRSRQGRTEFQFAGGAINARVLTLALQRAGPRVTRESLVTALEGLRGADLGGLVRYGANDHRAELRRYGCRQGNGQFVH